MGLPLHRSARGLHHDGEQRLDGHLAVRPREPLPRQQLADRQLGRQRPRQRLRLQQRADRQPRCSDLGVLGDRAVLVQRRDDLVRPAGADLRRERGYEPTGDPEADGRPPVLVRERPTRAAVAVLVGILPRRLRQRHDAQREPGRDRPHTRIRVRLPQGRRLGQSRRADRVAARIARHPHHQGRHLLRRAPELVEPESHPVRRQGRHLRLRTDSNQEPGRHLRRPGLRRDLGSP